MILVAISPFLEQLDLENEVQNEEEEEEVYEIDSEDEELEQLLNRIKEVLGDQMSGINPEMARVN